MAADVANHYDSVHEPISMIYNLARVFAGFSEPTGVQDNRRAELPE